MRALHPPPQIDDEHRAAELRKRKEVDAFDAGNGLIESWSARAIAVLLDTVKNHRTT